MTDVIKIRLFGSDDCKTCMKFKESLERFPLDFEYIDAMDDDTQELCDEKNIDELPHIEAYLDSDKEVIYTKIGFIPTLILLQEINEAQELKNDNTDRTFHGVRPQFKGPKIPNKPDGKCNGCGNE